MSENSDNEVFSPYVDETPISGTSTKSSNKSSLDNHSYFDAAAADSVANPSLIVL